MIKFTAFVLAIQVSTIAFCQVNWSERDCSNQRYPTMCEYYKKLGIGDDKSKNGDYFGAMKDYTSAINLMPNEAYGYVKRYIQKMLLSDFRGAIADINKVIKINIEKNYKPSEGDYTLRARCKYNLHDYYGAIADANFALQIFNQAKNDWDEGAADYEEAFAKDKGEIFLWRGLSKIKLKLVNSGCQDLSTAGELGVDVQEEIEYYCN